MDPNIKWETEAERHLKLVMSSQNEASTSNAGPRLPEEVATAPVFSLAVQSVLNNQAQEAGNEQAFPQYGLLGYRVEDPSFEPTQSDLLYTNVSAPWSGFICGSQGSGKSHTLSCLLENSLISNSAAGHLTSPLVGLVLHYDRFTSFSSSQLCEAAYLCSSGIPVRILVSPTNYHVMREAYMSLAGQGGFANLLTVEPMYLPQKELNVSMMKTVMGVQNKAEQPLYMQTVMKILRDMAIASQGSQNFDYNRFKAQLEEESLMRGQQIPLKMRLDVLESFFKPGSVQQPKNGKGSKASSNAYDAWKFPKGTLTIVDLSCSFVGADDACALFNICISLFLKDRHEAGRIIAMDEAHKFLTSASPEASELTETLLSIVRQQRHLGTRVVIATQEPTVSPSFLDLCNMTIIHRFASPTWFKAIKAHIAGAQEDEPAAAEVFYRIVRLATGEALLFCPTALLDVETFDVQAVSEDRSGDREMSHSSGSCMMVDSPVFVSGRQRAVQMGAGHAHIRVRQRITVDGGRSRLEC